MIGRRTLLTWLGLGAVGATAAGSSGAAAPGDNPYYQGPASDHFDGRQFFNPDGVPPASVTELLRWQFGGGRVRWPTSWPSPHAQATPETEIGSGLRVTMVGHATMLVQTAGLNFLTDPVWSERVSPFSFVGPRRVNAPGIAFENLPRIDFVLLSHNHYDHLDLATLKRLHETHDPLLVTPLGNDAIVRSAAPNMRIVARDWGDTVDAGAATIHLEPSHHWSARGTHDRRMALWSAFVIDAPGARIYFAGDTGFHDGRNFRAAREKHGGFRLALIPIGAYEPRWFMKPQHQNPAEAAEAFRLLEAGHAAGFHWGTFRLTNEGVEEPRAHLNAALDERGIPRQRFRPLLPGEVWDVPG